MEIDPDTGEVLEGATPLSEEEAVALEMGDDDDGNAPSDDETQAALPEPPEESGPSQEALLKLGRSFDTYGKKVIETYGEEAATLYPCPLCPDNHKGFIDLRHAGQLPNEITEQVYQYLTATDVTEFEQDPGTNTCPVCQGKTVVKTGAISGQWITRTCPNCGGYGFMPPPSEVVGSKGIGGIGNVVAIAPEQPQPQEDVDEWGEPRVLPDGTLNANYGMMPNRKTVHPVYGVTAQLTQQATG